MASLLDIESEGELTTTARDHRMVVKGEDYKSYRIA